MDICYNFFVGSSLTVLREVIRLKRNVEKMFTYLAGYFEGGNMVSSLRAMSFARDKHKDQIRDGGDAYIIHPLGMACHASDIGVRNDDIFAAILLHDVVEDCGVPLEGLPFNEKVKEIVRYVTVEKREGEEKSDTKKRYFRTMIYCPEAIIVKGLDRYNNLSTMTTFSPERIEKNICETEELLLPILKEAKDKYPEYRKIFYVLRDEIEVLSSIYKHYLHTQP